jgi:hypothetical protein
MFLTLMRPAMRGVRQWQRWVMGTQVLLSDCCRRGRWPWPGWLGLATFRGRGGAARGLHVSFTTRVAMPIQTAIVNNTPLVGASDEQAT